MRAVIAGAVLVLGCGGGAASSRPDVPEVSLDAATDALEADLPFLSDATDVTSDGGPRGLAGRRCGALGEWSRPLADYLAAGERVAPGGRFLRGVQDLAVFDDRLFLGYGDANINLGRATPIEFRAFTDDARPEAVAEFRTDEEQLEQYRALDGELWMAGVDAAEDAWLGNVYGRVGGRWTKHRTVQNGVHVHDIARWRGALWSVGSGATMTEWGAGQIYGHLWRSDDGARTWSIAARHHNMGVGDARWVRILPLRDALLLFGYRSNAMGRVSTVVNMRWDGAATSPLATGDALRGAFVTETLPLPGGGGLVRGGVNGASGTLVHRAFRVDAAGVATAIDGLAGRQVLDAWRDAETGEVLVMSAEGDEWGGAPLQYGVRVDVTRDLATFTELTRFVSDDAPRAVARWRGHVYVGRDDGVVLRCALE